MGASLKRSAENMRYQAVQRVLAGESPEKVIQELGFHRSRIYAWLKAYREQGKPGLSPPANSGRPSLLDASARKTVLQLLINHSPRQQGFNADLWSTNLVEALIEQKLAITLGKASLNKLLSPLGLQHRRLRHRLEQMRTPAIHHWLAEGYTELQQQAKDADSAIWLLSINVNESLGTQTLLAVSPRGELYFSCFSQLATQNCRNFLLALMRTINRKIFLLVNDKELPIANLLNSSAAQQLQTALGAELKIIKLPVSNRLRKSDRAPLTKAADNVPLNMYLREPFAKGGTPPLQDIKSWVLTLNHGLLNIQSPLSEFLGNLSMALKGAAVIASHLHAPSSLIRPVSKRLTLKSLIALNKLITDAWHDNPFTRVLKKPGDIYCLEDIVPLSEWPKYKYCRLHLSWNSKHVIALCYEGPDKTLCGLFISRQPGEPAFSPQERAFLLALRPHLEIATALAIRHWRDNFTVKALEDTTDHLEIAALVLDGNGLVIRASGAAQEMLSQKHYITSEKGRLTFNQQENQQKFQQAVAASIAWRQAPIGNKPVDAMRLSYPAGHWIGVLVQPITPPSFAVPHSAAVSPHVAVYITDPNKPRANPQHQLIVRLFNLSTREAYLTTLLTSGHSLAEAAATMNITQKTARGYLQHVYEKVGVNRRQDLIQRVMKSVALLA